MLYVNDIPAIIPPELLKLLCEIGHGDELIIGDENFPGESKGKRVVRMDGHGVPEILDAILQLMPLDQLAIHPAGLMQVTPEDPTETPILEVYIEIIAKYDERGSEYLEEIEHSAFYERIRNHSYVVIMSGEKAPYANIIP